MADEVPIGSVSVAVTADLTAYEAGLARARQEAVDFNRAAENAMSGATAATNQLGAAQRSLLEQMKAGKVSFAEAEIIFRKMGDAQHLTAAYADLLGMSQKTAGQSAEQLAARYDKLLASVSPYNKATLNLSKVLGEADALYKANAISAGQLATVTGAAVNKFENASRAIRGTTEELDKLRAAQAGANFRGDVENLFAAPLSNKSARESAGVFKDADRDAADAARSQAAADAATLSFQKRLNAQRAAEEANDAATLARAKATEDARTLAFQKRLTAQRAAQEAADDAAAASAARSETTAAGQVFALRQRLTAQRVALDLAATKTVAAEEAKVAAAMKAQAGQNFASDLNASFGIGLPAKSAKESAKVFEDLLPPIKKVGSEAHISALSVREFVVILREMARGDFSRLAGSATILGQQFGLLKFLMTGVGAGFFTLAAAMIGATVAAVAWDESQRKLANTLEGVGRKSGQSFAQITTAAETAAKASGQSLYATEAAASALAAAGARSSDSITKLSGDVAVFARLTGQKGPEALKELAGAMADPAKGAAQLNDQLELFDATTLRNIKSLQDSGHQMEAQAIITEKVHQATLDANKAGLATPSIWDQIGSAAVSAAAGIGQLTGAFTEFVLRANAAGDLYLAKPIDKVKAAAEQRRAELEAADNKASALAGQYADQTPEGQERAHFREMQDQATALQAGIAVEKRKGNTEQLQIDTKAYDALHDAIGRVTDAHGQYIRQADRTHEITKLETEAAEAGNRHNVVLRNQLATRIALLKAADSKATNADVQRAAADQGALAGARAERSTSGRDSFARQDASLQADAAGERDLAKAYLESDSAAIRAEASRKALTEAAKAGRTATQAAKLVQDELNLEVSKGAAEGAKKVHQLETEAAAQAAANAGLASGAMTRQEANRAVTEGVEISHLQALADTGDAKTKAVLLDVIQRLKAGYDALNASKEDAAAANMIDHDRDETEMLKLKLSLVNATASARDQAVARLRATQELGGAAAVAKDPQKQAAVSSAGDVAALTAQLAAAQSFKATSDSIAEETLKLNRLGDTLGMTLRQADLYEKEQELLNAAKKAGIELDEQERRKLHELASGYADAAESARKYEHQQKAAGDAAKSLADGVESGIEGMLFDGKKLNETMHDFFQGVDRNVLKATLTGEGPFAGLLGTDQSKTVGGPNGGVLSQLFGNLLGQGKGGAGKPTGAPGDPLYVVQAGAGGGAGGGGGILGSLGKLLGLGGGAGGGGDALASDFGNMASSMTLGNDVGMAALLHTGTSYVGTPSRMVATSPGLFLNAPRLHSGLAPDEFPAILQQGERVTEKGGGPAGRRGGDVHIHIRSDDPGSFGRSQGQIARETKRQMERS